MRYPLEVFKAVRETWPDHLPISVRISATDWMDHDPSTPSWTLPDAVEFSRQLKTLGVDIIDVSSGGGSPTARYGPVDSTLTEGYQVEFAERIKRETGVRVAGVGLIRSKEFVKQVLAKGMVDFVLMGREFLRNPYWVHHVFMEEYGESHWPRPYQWAVGGKKHLRPKKKAVTEED